MRMSIRYLETKSKTSFDFFFMQVHVEMYLNNLSFMI